MALADDLNQWLAKVLKIKDPEARLIQLRTLVKILDVAGAKARTERLELVKQLRKDGEGLTWDRLHVLSGLSTVYLMKKAGPKSQVPVEPESESTESEGSGEPPVEFDPYNG